MRANSDGHVHRLQPPKKPVILLLTDKITPPTLYKALSADYHRDFTFYSIKDDPEFKEVKEAYGLKKVPSLILWKGGEEVEIYDGQLKIGHISHWLKQAAGKKKDREGAKDEL